MKNVVVIPVYKAQLSHAEYLSLCQCLKILTNHHICLVIPKGLNTEIYQTLFQKYQVPFREESFDSVFFQDINGYNQLMMSKHFYERFIAFEYMLVYQLDAYVFRDELNEWCAKGYDYIGAPFFRKDKLDKKDSGNGGFSLRKILSFINLFSHNRKLLTFKGLLFYHRHRGPLHKSWFVLSGLFGRCNSLQSLIQNTIAEDLLYASLKYKREEKWEIPASEEAKFFSFEQFPSELFQLTGHRLPFGCHAWQKYEYDSFWKQFIAL